MTNEDDNDKCKIFTILLIGLVSLCVLTPKKPSISHDSQFTVVEAIPSPIYVPTAVYGSYMTIDGEVNEPNKIDYEFLADQITLCESGNNPDAKGDWNGKEYLANGIAQFHLDTFNSMKKQSGMYYLDYNNSQDQRKLLIWALVNGYGSHWTCYRNLQN